MLLLTQIMIPFIFKTKLPKHYFVNDFMDAYITGEGSSQRHTGLDPASSFLKPESGIMFSKMSIRWPPEKTTQFALIPKTLLQFCSEWKKIKFPLK